MRICVPKETHAGERRVSLLPASADKLIKLGAEITVEAGLGSSIKISDQEYQDVGVQIEPERAKLLSSADICVRLRKPSAEDVQILKPGCVHVSYLDPFNEKDLVKTLADAKVSAVSLEMIPRTTLAQKMDVLSSQANLAGYVAVILAAERLDKIFPMMMTPAGTISPSRVFIIGVGVAGLQAIATAKRLGARVEAFDTRPVVEEQVKSLGAKFVKIDLGEMGQTEDGYAKALTDEQLAKQQEGMAKHCALADIVITTAQLFGRKAPLIIKEDMVKQMKPGSIIVDLAAESGGNVAGTKVDEEVDVNGVKIIGLGNLPGHVAKNASEMYSANVTSFLTHFWDKDQKKFNLNREDEIIQGCLVTHEGQIVNEKLLSVYQNT